MGGAASAPDPVVRLAFWGGLAVLAVSLGVLLQILALRAVLLVREARRRDLAERWRPVFAAGLEETPAAVPRLSPAEVPSLLEIWNHYQASLRGDACERLNVLARSAGLRDGALRLLQQRRVRARLVAIRALGHLREPSAAEELWRIARGDHPTLSLAAARAMVQIDAPVAIARLMPLIGSRVDWPASRVGAMLREAGPAAVSEPLAHAAIEAAPEASLRLICHLPVAYHDAAARAVRQLLRQTDSDQVIAACLRVLTDPRDRDLVLAQVRHPSWYVRVQAATALGRIGQPGDERELAALLGDEEWWVRYRAAQAFAALPFIGLGGLEELLREGQDARTSEVLRHVIAERRTR